MRISNNLRKDYALIKFLYESYKEFGKSKKEADEACKYYKDGIRNYYRLKDFYNDDSWNFENPEDWDRRYQKNVFDFVFSTEDIEEYKKDNWQHWYNTYDDGRDCTGVWFTTSIRVFPIKSTGKTIVYHFQSMDV